MSIRSARRHSWVIGMRDSLYPAREAGIVRTSEESPAGPDEPADEGTVDWQPPGRVPRDGQADRPGLQHGLGYCFYLEQQNLFPSIGQSWRTDDRTLELSVRQYIAARDMPVDELRLAGRRTDAHRR